jgi:chemotaxis signal transduction protein
MVIPYHQTSITVFDLKKKLYNEYNTDKNIIVVISINDVFYGIIVDKVIELFETEETNIKNVDFLKQTITNNFITNQFKFKDDFAFVVDPMKLIN